MCWRGGGLIFFFFQWGEGTSLSPLASAVGGDPPASTHVSYSITGALLWYSILVRSPCTLHVGVMFYL